MGSDNGVSKKVIIWLVVASVLLALVLVATFLLFFKKQTKSDVIEMDTGTIIMTYSDDSNVFALKDMVPTKDTEGVKSEKYYDFAVSTTFAEAKSIDYEVVISVDDKNSTIDEKDIHFYLEKQKSGTFIKVLGPASYETNKSKTELGANSGTMTLAKASKEVDSVDNYRLRMWLSEDVNVSKLTTKDFAVKIEIYGKAN